MNQMSSSFSSLPTELLTEIINYIWKNTDLHSLCQVSKHISDITTPLLYYEVNLTKEDQKCSIKEKINSLLIKPSNLQFVRILKMPQITPDESLLMDHLLPQLQKDFLKEIQFISYNVKTFSMPYQMEFLWYNQKNLQNLTLRTHMVPWLKDFLEEPRPGQSDILKLFTDLEISGTLSPYDLPSMQKKIVWPLENLDLSGLQKLKISTQFVDYSTFSKLDTLFGNGSFVNLTELRFEQISNYQTLKLTHMPSLKLLEVSCCDSQTPNLVLADDIRISSFVCKNGSGLEKIIPVLTQVIGLEYLSLDCTYLLDLWYAQTQRDFISAIVMHKDTLRELSFCHRIVPLDSDLETLLLDFFRIRGRCYDYCKQQRWEKT